MTQQMQTIGFIVMSLMGKRMAARLLEAGYPYTVYTGTRERSQPRAERGAKVADSPQELARMVEAVMLSLADDAAVEETMYGPEGVLGRPRADATVIDLSTISPRTSRTVALAVQATGASIPAAFPLQYMDKDFGLIGGLASQADVPMPATTAACQMGKAAHADGLEGDFSVVMHLMRQLAGLDEHRARQSGQKGGAR